MRTVDGFLNSSRNFIWKSRIVRAPLFNTTGEVSGKISFGGNIALGKRAAARVYISQATSNGHYQLVHKPHELYTRLPREKKILRAELRISFCNVILLRRYEYISCRRRSGREFFPQRASR